MEAYDTPMLKWAKERYWVSVAIAAVLPSVLAGIVEYVWTKGVSGLAPIAFALIGGLGAMAVLRFVHEPKQVDPSAPIDQPASAATPESQTERKDFSPRTPAELVASIKGLTEIAAKNASQRHLGLWMKVEGRVSDVSEAVSPNIIMVHINESTDGVSVFLDFDKNHWGARPHIFGCSRSYFSHWEN